MTSVVHGDPALAKLINMLGREKAEQLAVEIATELNIRGTMSPTDRLRFGDALVKRGGVLEAIGRSIKVQALLQGAQQSSV
jgi:hypothetical protein